MTNGRRVFWNVGGVYVGLANQEERRSRKEKKSPQKTNEDDRGNMLGLEGTLAPSREYKGKRQGEGSGQLKKNRISKSSLLK